MSLMDRFVVVMLFSLIGLTNSQNTRLKERFSWKIVDFQYPSDNARSEAIKSGKFIPENNLPLGVEAWKNKLFVTLPAWKDGVAATVTYIDLDATTEKSPKLKPYPNWEAQNYRENNGVGKLASVFRMHVDICDRLWMLDTGLVNILVKPDMVYMPKIVVYDLKNDQLLLEFTIPQDIVKPTTFFANIISDVKDSCENTYAYMADIGSYAIAVYHLATNRIWRVTHSFFYFEPTKGDYNIGGINFQWKDGVFGLALSGGIDECCHKTLYFHAVSGTKQFAVSTEIIQNETIASTNYHAYKELGDRGDHGHSTGCSFHEPSSVLFFTLISKNAVGCWNSKSTEYSSRTLGIVASDNITMNYPNDLKVDKKGVLWVLTDRLVNFWYDHLDYNDVNFRIFSAPVAEAIKGTVCEQRSS